MEHTYFNIDSRFCRALPRLGTGWNNVSVRGMAAANARLLGGQLSLPSQAAVAVTVAARPRIFESGEERSLRFTRTGVGVVNADTVSAGLLLGHDTAVLSFANAEVPGGRYCTDGRAQEEDLCRLMPQLHPSLVTSGAYPLNPQVALVSKSLAVARKPLTYELLDPISQRDRAPSEEDPEVTSAAGYPSLTVITAAMPCGPADAGRPKGGWIGSKWDDTVTLRIRSVLNAAVVSGHSNLVLGAFGCGAFGNPTQPVAHIFRRTLESDEFRGAFQTILFAIIDPLGTGNLRPFRDEMLKLASRENDKTPSVDAKEAAED